MSKSPSMFAQICGHVETLARRLRTVENKKLGERLDDAERRLGDLDGKEPKTKGRADD